MPSSNELEKGNERGMYIFNLKFSIDILDGYRKWSKVGSRGLERGPLSGE